MSDAIICVENLDFSYTGGAAQASQGAALTDVTLEIERGSCTAIIGVTGSGKSTLVQHFNGLLRPTSGTVIVDGIDVGAKDTDLRRLRQRVGILFQFPEKQLFEQTIFADVAFGPRRMRIGRREIRVRVLHALEKVGLPPKIYAHRSPFELSGGQMRRVALAGVLAMMPTILILDEPTVGLDADGRAEFYTYVQRLKQEFGVTLILVSHDMTEVASLADTLLVLHEGHLVMQGTPRHVFAEGDALHSWGLVPPPLSDLLALLRRKGVEVPKDIVTLEEAYVVLQEIRA